MKLCRKIFFKHYDKKMKKLLSSVIILLFYSNISFSNIIYRNCNLEPNYEPGSEIKIDLESKIIKVYVPEVDGFAIHEISKAYGTVLVSTNLKYTSHMTQDATEMFTDQVMIEKSFDIENHTVSILIQKKNGITKEMSKMLDDQEKDGKISFSIQDKCDVENTYDPMKQKKLLKEIGS